MAKKATKPDKGPPPDRITTILDALKKAVPRPVDNANREEKQKYAGRLSRHLATCFANALRPSFPGIVPTETGGGQESSARTSKGVKKIDIGYSTLRLGLALGVSLKSVNFRDLKTGRYTKNYTARDGELRAEAMDYHERQPYAVMIGILFLPFDSCDDGNKGTKEESGISSFGAAVRSFRPRANRKTPRDEIELFERFFIALYEPAGENMGHTVFFDVLHAPPRNRRPRPDEVFTFEQVIEQITFTYDLRNNPPFTWAE